MKPPRFCAATRWSFSVKHAPGSFQAEKSGSWLDLRVQSTDACDPEGNCWNSEWNKSMLKRLSPEFGRARRCRPSMDETKSRILLDLSVHHASTFFLMATKKPYDFS